MAWFRLVAFSVDFESLHTNIPVKHTIQLMKELVFEYNHVISNADFIIDSLEIVLEICLMEFHREYFEHFFGIIMGTNVAPIIANLYLAKLEKKNWKINPSTILKWFDQYSSADTYITDLAEQKDQECWILDSGIQQASEIYKNRQIQIWFQSRMHRFDYF